MADNAYLPQRSDYTTHRQWQDALEAHRMIHDLRGQVSALQAHIKGQGAASSGSKAVSFINGLPVSGSPKNGQVLAYNSRTAQLEWS